MTNANTRLLDAQVSHAVGLQRYSAGVINRVIATLNKADADLVARLAIALQDMTPTSFTVYRLEAILKQLREMNARVYEQVLSQLQREMAELVVYEAGFQERLFRSSIPKAVQASYAIRSINVERAQAAALARPFQGRLLKEWAATLEADKLNRIRDAVRMGFVQNETVDSIVRRIRGTKAAGFADGIIETDRRAAASVAKTATMHTAAYAKDEFHSANEDLLEGELWVSTLDTKTTPVCQANDGKVYKLGTGPRPPIHWNCRSTVTPVLKSWRKLGIDPRDTATRASMDGQLPAKLTYEDWLRSKPADVQDDILGPTRGKLFRDGEISLDRFVDRSGGELTLKELRERDPEIFKRAGLD